jgi:4-amino-4-deoxy-L-arabinose transferase-like glycosyltransferase
MNAETASPGETGRPGQRWIHALALLLVIAFGASLRITAMLDTRLVSPLEGDSTGYVAAAYNLRQFGVFSNEHSFDQAKPVAPRPDALVRPGYPAMLALFLPDRPDYPFLHRVQWVQALLGIALIGLTYLFAAQLLPKTAALALAALVAIHPQLIVLGTALLTETLFSVVVAAFLYAITRAGSNGSAYWYGIAGALIGLSAWVRPTLQFLPLLLVPALAWLLPRTRWRNCASLVLAAALVFAPWILRNERAIGVPTDTTLMTSTLLHGSYPDFMYHGDPRTRGFAHRFDPEAAAIRTPAQALARIVANFRSAPAQTLRWYLLSKPVRFFDWEFIEGSGDIFINTVSRTPYRERRDFIDTYWVMRWLHWPLIVLGYVGILYALLRAARKDRNPQDRAWGLLAVTMIFVIALHALGLPLARYSVPFRPLMYLFAIGVVVATARRLRPTSR